MRCRFAAYYLGDFDPSGFDMERDLREKLERYSARHDIHWRRLAVLEEDFQTYNLICLPVKEKDRRAKGFVEEHGRDCAEVDAIAPTELRGRVQEAIEGHIDPDRWARLRLVEEQEQETLQRMVDGWRKRK
jgi:hypothetical protein